MRLLTVSDLDSSEGLGTYKLRDSVTATYCPDGVTVTDAAGAGMRAFGGPCYLIVNDEPDGGFASPGDRFDIVPADMFGGLFTFEGEIDQTRPEPGDETVTTESNAFSVGDKNPHVVHNDDGSVTVDGVTYGAPAERTEAAEPGPIPQ